MEDRITKPRIYKGPKYWVVSYWWFDGKGGRPYHRTNSYKTLQKAIASAKHAANWYQKRGYVEGVIYV